VSLLPIDRTKGSCAQITKTLKNIESGEVRARRITKIKKLKSKLKSGATTRRSHAEMAAPSLDERIALIHDPKCGKRTVEKGPLGIVHSFGYRTLLIEDIFSLAVNQSINIFFREAGSVIDRRQAFDG
jgi:hypothetical protein